MGTTSRKRVMAAAVCGVAFLGCGGADEDGGGGETEWVKVEGGTYQMGDPGAGGDEMNVAWPVHEVTVKTFWMASTEVTNAQFADYLNTTSVDNLGKGQGGKTEIDLINAATGIERADDGTFSAKGGMGSLPVVNVSATGAARYAEWAGARLPSEEEWEFAARGGTLDVPGRYSGTDQEGMDYDVGWTSMYSEDGPRTVGTKPANELGLYDMTGNVWEFCQTPFTFYPGHPLENRGGGAPAGPINRGGSFHGSSIAVWNRAYAAHYEVTTFDIGFRMARDTDPALDASRR